MQKTEHKMRLLLVVAFVIVGIGCMFRPMKVMAATSPSGAAGGAQRETTEPIPLNSDGSYDIVGRYALNYTGNTNYSGTALSNGEDHVYYRDTTLAGFQNSSKATLQGDNNTTRVVKAYLVWETRKRYSQYDESANHVRFIMRDGNGINIYPDRVYVDDRSTPYVSGWESSRPRVYCNVADVTSIVQAYGYGDYYVANIPEFHTSDLYANDDGGGNVPSGWQLIVVEENESYPVRAVVLSAGSTYRFGSYAWEHNDYGTDEASRATVTMSAALSGGLKTKAYGNATGQVLFGGIDAGSGDGSPKQISLFTQQNAYSSQTYRYAGDILSGLYCDGSRIADGWDMGAVLYDVSGLEYNASVFGTTVSNVHWNTQLYMGAAVDIAFPDFESYQTTTINSSTSATVSGKITNTSPQENTGIYDGNLTVDLDSALTPDAGRCTVKVNGVSQAASVQIVHTGDHYQVQFYGGDIVNFMKGSTLEYSIGCTMNASGRTKINNSDAFNGYLRSDDVNTGYWINKAWTSSSYAAVYTISYNPNGGSGSISSDATGDGGKFTLKSGFSAGGYSFTGYAVVRSSDNAVFCGSLGWQPMSAYGNQPDKWTIYQPGQTYTIDGAWKNPSRADGDTFTFCAQWKLEYTIHFDGNGATGGSMSDLTCTYDESRSLPANKYTRTGYIFKGWNTKANGRGTAYADKATVKNLANVSGATVTLYAQWTPIKYTIRFDGNGATGGSMSNITCTYDQSKTLSANQYGKTGHHFTGWNTKADGSGTSYAEKATVKNLANKNGAVVTLYAQWEANTYTIRFHPNDGGEETPIPDMTVHYGEQINLPDGAQAYIKYTLDGVNVTQDVLDGTIVLDDIGAVVMRLDKESGRMLTPDGAVVNEDGSISRTNEDGTITVTYPDGTVVTMDSDGTILPDDEAAGEDPAEEAAEDAAYGDSGEDEEEAAEDAAYRDSGEDEEDVSENGEVKNGDSDEESMPEDDMTSDTNTNKEASETTEGDQAEATNETENAGTASVERKAVSRSAAADDPKAVAAEVAGAAEEASAQAEAAAAAEEASAQTELTEDSGAEPQPNQKAYASVFMGWSLEGEKDGFVPQWTVSNPVNVSVITDMSGVTDTDGAVITLYAVWDDCPWIVAENLYYTLTQAQSGFITQDELLGHATAYDREDGSPIAPGVHDNGTSFTIPDYLPADFTQFEHEGSITENLTVTDSAASTYRKQITVYIVDTTAVAVKPEGTTRFINEYYYNQPYENGGLEENSIWKTDSEYRQVLQTAFDNMRNDTPILTFTFSHEDVQKMKAYVETQGVERIGQPETLESFYDRFCAVNRVN